MIDLPNQEVLLLKQIAAGSDKAASDLYRQYDGFVYAYVRHLLPDNNGAEEVCQDVFLAAFSKPDKFAGQSKFSTWLCAIAKFKAADWWRKSSRSVPIVEVDDDLLAEAKEVPSH